MDSQLVPIIHVQAHEVRGETRWTGLAQLTGVMHRNVLILKVKGVLTAVINRCPHRDVPLLLGRLKEDDEFLECPSHGWELPVHGHDLRGCPVIEQDGAWILVLDPPAAIPVHRQPKIEETACPDGAEDPSCAPCHSPVI